uniref:Uncharacterized protein n=1 Tax=Aegilops tauschii subsp. strangulata TaxID=200361 RepID=A0A453HGX2_AEGTS
METRSAPVSSLRCRKFAGSRRALLCPAHNPTLPIYSYKRRTWTLSPR